jgi:hypothetical protein
MGPRKVVEVSPKSFAIHTMGLVSCQAHGVLLIWGCYSAQIVLFGGEITHVYAQQRLGRAPAA